MSVDKTCSFSVILHENCGPTRGEEKIFFLHECVHEISNHLRRCHLSRENVTEIDLSASKVKDVLLCAQNREITLAGIDRPPEPANTRNTPGSIKESKKELQLT